MRTKYATEQQNKWIEEYLAIAKPGIDKLRDAGMGGYWAEAKTVLSFLGGNDNSWVARSIAEGIANLDSSMYVDDRVGGAAVSTAFSGRVTRGDMVKAIKALRKAFEQYHDRVKSNPRKVGGWSQHRLGGQKQWHRKLGKVSIDVQWSPHTRVYSAQRIDAQGVLHHMGEAKTLAAAKALALGQKRNPQDGLREVSKAQFYAAIGPLDVHPHLVGNYPYTSIFRTRSEVEVGRAIGDEGSRRYFLKDSKSNPKKRPAKKRNPSLPAGWTPSYETVSVHSLPGVSGFARGFAAHLGLADKDASRVQAYYGPNGPRGPGVTVEYDYQTGRPRTYAAHGVHPKYGTEFRGRFKTLKDAIAAAVAPYEAGKVMPNTNPAYKAAFVASGDRTTVRKALKAQGYLDIRVRGGSKKAPSAYNTFMKEQMPVMKAKGFTTAAAMKEIGALWKKQNRKSNPAKKPVWVKTSPVTWTLDQGDGRYAQITRGTVGYRVMFDGHWIQGHCSTLADAKRHVAASIK